jgi:hypothetical protein
MHAQNFMLINHIQLLGYNHSQKGTIHKLSGGSPTTGNWIHLAITYDGSAVRLYVDGTEVDSKGVSGSFESENVIQLGTDEASSNDNHGYWDGKIDEVRTYSRGLTSSKLPRPEGRGIQRGLPF